MYSDFDAGIMTSSTSQTNRPLWGPWHHVDVLRSLARLNLAKQLPRRAPGGIKPPWAFLPRHWPPNISGLGLHGIHLIQQRQEHAHQGHQQQQQRTRTTYGGGAYLDPRYLIVSSPSRSPSVASFDESFASDDMTDDDIIDRHRQQQQQHRLGRPSFDAFANYATDRRTPRQHYTPSSSCSTSSSYSKFCLVS